jgi:D,D-heptose 1,7-bisphosphate phosphatase
MQHPVVFVDKDGTLIKDVPYNIDPARIILEEGVASGLRRLAEAGFHFVVVSNQSGVARGYFPEEALDVVAAHLDVLLQQAAGTRLDGFYYCPHHPDGVVSEYMLECACRKPRPGMLLAAAAELDIQLQQAWMVGDILNDVEAGNRAGCRTILIDNGNETEWQDGPLRTPDFTAANFAEAAEIILAETKHAGKIHQVDMGAESAKRGDFIAEHLDE